MNHTPIFLLVGQAGSGKDTIADFMVKNHNAIKIAQADPMKALAMNLFRFTEEQLWGPSEMRNTPDSTFNYDRINKALDEINSWSTGRWIKTVLPEADVDEIRTTLAQWVLHVKMHTLDLDKPVTPRFVLQTMGTEWGRNLSRDMWTNAALRIAFDLLAGNSRYDRNTAELVADPSFKGPDLVVITDGRFRNEIVNVLRSGGQVVRIDSPNSDGTNTEKAGVKGHQSEAEQKGLPVHFFTGFILNDKSKGLRAAESYTTQLVQGLTNGSRTTAGYPQHEARHWGVTV